MNANFPRYLMDPHGVRITSRNQHTGEKTVYVPIRRRRPNYSRYIALTLCAAFTLWVLGVVGVWVWRGM